MDGPHGTTATGSFRDTHVTPGPDTVYQITGGNEKADKGSTWTLIASTPRVRAPPTSSSRRRRRGKYKTTLV